MPFFFPFLITLVGLFRAGVSAFKDREFRALAFMLAVLLLSGMVFYHEVEGWRYLDSLYFSVTTLTTIGFGDFAPHTDAGKVFTIIYVFMGLGVIFGFIEKLAEHAGRHQMNRFSDVSRFAKLSKKLGWKTWEAAEMRSIAARETEEKSDGTDSRV